MSSTTLIDPKDAKYPLVPTPKEMELSRQVMELQQEKDQREHGFMTQIRDLETQTHKLQIRVHEVSEMLASTKREHMEHQQDAVEQERMRWKHQVCDLQTQLQNEKNEKEAQKKWQVKFSSTEAAATAIDSAIVDPVDEVFARFAQSIALLPSQKAPKVTQAGVLPFLVHLLRENLSDVVTGSVLLALVHLAIHDERLSQKHQSQHQHRQIRMNVTSHDTASVNIKEEIVKSGVAAPLAHILEHIQNPRVLVEANRLCTALSGHIPNKRILASKNTVRLLIHLLIPDLRTQYHNDRINSISNDTTDDASLLDSARLEKLPLAGDSEVHKYALSALVNLSHDSEILRSQIVNFSFFLPIVVRYIRESSDRGVQAEAAKLLGNLAYNHVVNQNAIMTAEGDAALTKQLTAENLHSHPDLVRACAIGIANLAYTSVNQLSIGYGDAMTFMLQMLVDSTSPRVLEAAAIAISCLCHQNPLNKSRVAAQNGLQVLLYVISQSHRYGNDEGTLVAASDCFAVIAHTKPNRHQVFDLDGHLPICQLCKHATSEQLLEASTSAICALIPSKYERQSLLADGREAKLETHLVGLSALERAKHLISQHRSTFHDKSHDAGVVPLWLTKAIQVLSHYANPNVATANVELEDEESLAEFHERSYFSLESLTIVPPDPLCPHFYNEQE